MRRDLESSLFGLGLFVAADRRRTAKTWLRFVRRSFPVDTPGGDDVSADLMPANIARLPRDKHDRPVPWFVTWIDGQPDFRVIGPGKLVSALRDRRCWTCGGPRGSYMAFLIGPMCAVNRVSAEPPSHRDCAVYSATHCPFLTTPNMVRRERHMPDGTVAPAGEMIRRNPGVALVWITRTVRLTDDGNGGLLFSIGDPTETLWFAEGRQASRSEVLASIDTGLPTLRDMAEQDGPDAVALLERMHADALRHVPEAVPV